MFLLLFIISSSHSFFLNPIRVFKYSNHHFLGRLTPRYNILFTALEPLSNLRITYLLIHRMVAPDIDFLAGFDSFTKSIGNLGATAPLALGVFYYMQQDNKKFEAAQKAASDLLLKDIKTTSELLLKDIKTTSELLSKDIKTTSELLSKDIKANSAEIKATTDLLAKDIKSTSENIDKLSKFIMDFTKKSS